MKLKVITLRLDPATGMFDDGELHEYLKHREALDVSEQFFVHERVPTWALLVSYREIEEPAGKARSREPRPDPAAELSAEDRPLPAPGAQRPGGVSPSPGSQSTPSNGESRRLENGPTLRSTRWVSQRCLHFIPQCPRNPEEPCGT